MNFTRFSKAKPCPICQHPYWCRVFADGWAECMRVQSATPAKSGGWMHRLGNEQHGAHGVTRPTSAPKCEPPGINATALMRAWAAATPPAALADFGASLGVSVAALTAVGTAWAAPHAAWAFPMRDGHGNAVGIRLRNDQGKFAVRGSRQGLFLAAVAPQPTLFVCEGPTDTAAALDLGLFAVGRPNCCCGGAELRIYARRHDCRRVVLVADNDKPGLDGARKAGGELRLPFAIYVPPAKDVREFVRLGGTRLMIENTLKGTLWRNG